MENSIDGDTDCSERSCPTDRCLLLDKRDKQTLIMPNGGETGDGEEDEEEEDDEDVNNKRTAKAINTDDPSGQSIDVIKKLGLHHLTYSYPAETHYVHTNQGSLGMGENNLGDNVPSLLGSLHVINNLEHHQPSNKNPNKVNLDQTSSKGSHNRSENGLNNLDAELEKSPRDHLEKKLPPEEDDLHDEVIFKGGTLNGNLTPSKGETISTSNGVITLSHHNNLLSSNITSNYLGCLNGCNNGHQTNSNNGNGKSAKCVRRLVSSDSGGSNKSSSKSGRKSRSWGPPQAPPDGGWGWVVVFASFMISLIADGVSLSYGFFQMDLSDHFRQSKGKTALVGSLLLSMPALTGPIASALTDRYGCRTMTIVSGLLSASGFILGCFASSLEHLFIAFSITGIGLSLCYVTSIVIVAYYFNTKRSLATGLAVCGTGIGTFLFAPLTTYLLKEYSWRGTLLIMAGFFLNIIVFGALMRDINVSEVDPIEEQDESDSDADEEEDSVNEPITELSNFPFTCCNNNCLTRPAHGANHFLRTGPSNDPNVNNHRNNFPFNPLAKGPMIDITGTHVHSANQINCKLSNNLDNFAPTLKPNHGSPAKPISSICIYSHCCSSTFPHNDEQLCNNNRYNEAHGKTMEKTIPSHDYSEPEFQSSQQPPPYAHSHNRRCNHRFQRFQSSYTSSVPKSDLRNYSSLVNIPTYITTNGLVSKDVLDEISGRKDGNLNQLLQKYPNLLSILNNCDQGKSVFLSSRTIGKDQASDRSGSPNLASNLSPNPTKQHPLSNGLPTGNIIDNASQNQDTVGHKPIIPTDGKRRFKGDLESGLVRGGGGEGGGRMVKPVNQNLFLGHGPLAPVNGSKMQRTSLTYRTAVFRDVRRYRVRSSSAPDIFTNSMVTIAERETFLNEIKQVLLDSVDLSIFKNLRFTIFCLSNFVLHGCVDVPYVYLPDHAISSGICVKEMAFYLISVLGIANTLGTIIVGYIGDKPWLRPSTWYSGLTALSGISMALIPLARNYYLLAALAAIFGFSVSANYTLVSVILVDIISLDKFTNAYGLMLLVQGIASMLGPPIAGWLFDISGDYNITFYVIGLCVFASGAIVAPLKESPSKPSSSAASPSSSSSNNGSSVIESPSRTSSPTEDKMTALKLK